MSFNDLKPIYKEFLLKLAVTLTKDELYQRSKSIMRRQKKKKLRKKNNSTGQVNISLFRRFPFPTIHSYRNYSVCRRHRERS